MGSEQQCGLGSLVPMSCRGRAEAFARRLHTRLRRLGAEPPSEQEQTTWTGAPNNTDSDIYFDFDAELESPSSPVEETPQNILVQPNHNADRESGCVLSSPVDVESPPSNSDSDATYYDLDVDPDSKLSNYLKLQKINEEKQPARTVPPKLKLVAPTSEIIDQLFQNRAITPERSPIKTQPLARDNGFADYGSIDRRDSQNSLYTPIRFDDCQRRNSAERQLGEASQQNESILSPESNFNADSVSDDISQANSDESTATVLESSVADLNIDDAQEASENDLSEAQSDLLEELAIEKQTVDDSIDLNVGADAADAVTDADEGDDRPLRVRRCSSLRSGKTPPGTPGRKKIVRFADVLGLDLADVKTFMDDIPNIPKSAFEDLQDAEAITSSTECFVNNEIPSMKISDKRLVPMFQQPGDQPNFLDVLNNKNVCLESACVQEGATIAICGTVRVRNLDFHKSVQIRYTLDGWKNFSDLQASYAPNSCDGFSDRFQFLLYAHTLQVGQTLEFAVRFMCKGCLFWDNNSGDNYCFQCLSSSNASAAFYVPPTLNPVDNWHASFF